MTSLPEFSFTPSACRSVWMAGVVGSWMVGAPAAEAATDAELKAALVEYNQHAHYPLPTLTSAHRKRLLAGEVVKIIDMAPDGSGSRRAVGLIVTPHSRDVMWVSCQDPHYTQSDVVREYRMSMTPPDKTRWYGMVDLPRPFSDRHYVVDVWNNHTLAAATENRAWEHPWNLVPGAVTGARAVVDAGKVPQVTVQMWEDAVETPTNMGAWVAIALPDGGSLFAYHAATRVGGNIPEGLMLQYVKATLDSTLMAIEKRAQQAVEAHYTAGHSPVVGGDGGPVAPFPR